VYLNRLWSRLLRDVRLLDVQKQLPNQQQIFLSSLNSIQYV